MKKIGSLNLVDGRKINLDSTLYEPVDLKCRTEKCSSKSCCYRNVKVDLNEMKNIVLSFNEIPLYSLSEEKTKGIINKFTPFTVNNEIRRIAIKSSDSKKCIFLGENDKCILFKRKSIPSNCRAFPVSLEQNTLHLFLSKKECFSFSEKPAYISFKKEILQLISDEDYNNLKFILDKEEKKYLFLGELP